MAMDFPSSPTEGQIYTPAGGPSFVYKAPAWRQVTTVQAIQLATAESRNRIVNGAMQISQELADAGSAVSGAYPVDQFQYWHGGLGTVSAARAAMLSPNGSQSLATWLGAAKPTPAATDYWYVRQAIEGIRLKDFQWGTANAKQAILRFWAYNTQAGTYGLSVFNAAANRTFLATYTLVASTWKEVVIVIPGDTTGVWPTDTGVGMRIDLRLVNGSNTVGGAAGWNAGNFGVPPGCTNGANIAFNAYFADVGLYLDPNNTGIAPPWQTPDFAAELALCQRYWQFCPTLCAYGYAPTAAGYYALWTHTFPTTMRATPGVAVTASGSTNGAMYQAGHSANGLGMFGVESRVTGLMYLNYVSMVANARM